MGMFRRWLDRLFTNKPSPKTPPAWASFFSAEQYGQFLHLVAAHFRSKGVTFEMGDGVVLLEPGSEGRQQLGLLNLAQLCGRNEPAEWPQIIAEHFDTLNKSQREQQVLEERVADFERVRELLAVRLWPEDYLRELDGSKLIHRQDIPGTVSALVFDLPSSIRNVTPEEAEGWGMDLDELFELGLANVRENCIPDQSEQELTENVSVQLFSDESFFVASHALMLDDHGECIGSFGALVGIPHRHVLLAYPIENLNVLQAIHCLIPVISGMERDGPGSISPRLYWYKDGAYTDLPYRIEGRTLHFSPPEDFVEMLNLLSEGEPSGGEPSEGEQET